MDEIERNSGRPDPDVLLKKINRQMKKRGMLTVFLGAMAGVGKTFSMLQATREKLHDGHDIIIGWIETHGRSETDKMAQGLPTIAPAERLYNDKVLLEMDTDAILRRKPEIVVVDELAHSNIPGSRHKRRYQDVEELLEAGINVYTAVNIQHIESLNDIIAKITGVVVRETVPDFVLELADTVKFIDIAPEDLMQRLRDGKIYIPIQAEKALKSFFRQGNISALRELALRFMAQHVDKDLEEYMREHNISGPWQASGKVLVGVSGSPFSAQLIRAAARLASGLRSELLAVHVETPTPYFPMGEEARNRIAQNMRLAEDLGARTMTIVGENFVEEFLEIAHNQNIAAIVVGKSNHRKFMEVIRGGSVVDNIIRMSGDTHVYVIQGSEEKKSKVGGQRAKYKQESVHHLDYVLSGLMTVGVGVGLYLLHRYLSAMDAAMICLVPVLLSAVWWGRWPSYFTAFSNVLAFDFLFIEPLYTFKIGDLQSLWSFVIFLMVSFLIGGRTEKLREEMRQARQQEKSTRAVYEFSRDIIAVTEAEAIGRWLVRHAGETIERKTIVVLPGADGMENSVIQFDFTLGKAEALGIGRLKEAEFAVVDWVYKNNREAGCSTDTLPGVNYLYLPLSIKDKVYGVFGVYIADRSLTSSERRMVDAWGRLSAIAMERSALVNQAYQANLLLEADKLRGALFSSISHELKTPLAATLGSVSMLLEHDVIYSDDDRRELLTNIKESSLRMERLISNLLDTARLESGMMQLKYDWCDVQDLVGTSLRDMAERLGGKKVQVEIVDDLPLVRGDFVLLEQVLVNLVDNALKYSPNEAQISIEVKRLLNTLEISVMDRGYGISDEGLPKIFDKFYREKHVKKISGTGLGLAICKGIVEAHHGHIYAENRAGGGAIFSFTLPITSIDGEKVVN